MTLSPVAITAIAVVRGPGGKTHHAGKAIAAEPARHLLEAVCEKDKAQHQTKDRYGGAVLRCQQYAKRGKAFFLGPNPSGIGIVSNTTGSDRPAQTSLDTGQASILSLET